jgi:hypothetical protein
MHEAPEEGRRFKLRRPGWLEFYEQRKERCKMRLEG